MGMVDYLMLKDAIDTGLNELNKEILSNVDIFSNEEYGLEGIKNAIKNSGTDIRYRYYEKNFPISTNTVEPYQRNFCLITEEIGDDITLDNLTFYQPDTSAVIPGSAYKREMILLLAGVNEDGLPVFDSDATYTYLLYTSSAISSNNTGTVPSVYVDFTRMSNVTEHEGFSPDYLFYNDSQTSGGENISNPASAHFFFAAKPKHVFMPTIFYPSGYNIGNTFWHIVVPDSGLYIPKGYGIFYSHLHNQKVNQMSFKAIYH